MQKFVILLKKNFKINIWKVKNIVKLEIIVIIQENNLKHSIPKKIPIDFYTWSNYDYHLS